MTLQDIILLTKKILAGDEVPVALSVDEEEEEFIGRVGSWV